MNADDHIEPIQHYLRFEAEKLVSDLRVTTEMLEAARLDANMYPFLGECLLIRLSTFIMRLEQQHTIKVPATWWDHLKQRFAPQWVITRWPINYRTYSATVYFPHMPAPATRRYFEAPIYTWQEASGEHV